MLLQSATVYEKPFLFPETEVEKAIKGHCPNCRGDRNATIRGFFKREEKDDEIDYWTREKHYILQCDGCETVFHRKEEAHSQETDPDTNRPIEKVTHWPPPAKRDRPQWLDWEMIFGGHDTLYQLTADIYTALDNDLPILACIGARTTFDHASELLGIDPALSFQKKLEELGATGQIGFAEMKDLEILTEAGNAAAHRGWRPAPAELDTLMSILEQFIYRAFVISEDAKKLRARIPPRPAKSKKYANSSDE